MRSPDDAHRHLRPAMLIRRLESGAPLEELPEVRECPRCREVVRVLGVGFEGLGPALEPAPPAPLEVPAALRMTARAEELAGAILTALEEGGRDGASRLVAERSDDAALEQALLFACQRAAPMALRAPARALELADLAVTAVRERPSARLADLVGAEAALLSSTALLMLGRTEEALEAARSARRLMETAGAPELSIARAIYHEGAALGSAGSTEEALGLLEEARVLFADAGQDHWIGRAEAAIGLALFQRSLAPEALRSFESALTRLDPELDGPAMASIQQNRALLLTSLGRLEQARAAFSDALELALRSGAAAIAVAARVNLLGLAISEARYAEVVAKGPRVLELAERAELPVGAFYCRLFLSEAHMATGNYGAARALLSDLRRNLPEELSEHGALVDELAGLDPSDREGLDQFRRVREVLLGKQWDRVERASG